jgi:hypothetical protein
MVALSIGILLVVLSANGRLQNVVAAILGQTAPGAMPIGAGSGSGGGSNSGDDPDGLGGLFDYLTSGGGGDDTTNYPDFPYDDPGE